MSTSATKIEQSSVSHLRLEGPCLDAVRVERLRHSLRESIANGARAIVIDLERIEALDPLGLAGLSLLHQDAAPNARIALASLGPAVQEAVLLVHLHEVIDIYEDSRAAMLDFSSSTGKR